MAASAFLFSIVRVVFGFIVRWKATETPAFEKVRDEDDRSAAPLRDVFRRPALRNTVLGLLSRWSERAAFSTWGVFAISYATGTLKLERVPVLIAVTVAALLMAALQPVSGLLTDRFGARAVYASGIVAYAVGCSRFRVVQHRQHDRLRARNVGGVRRDSRVVPRRPGHALGVYGSGLTPLILTALISVVATLLLRPKAMTGI
nr:major facilitator superfamily protein [Mycolicibacterium malmesburyense]